MTLNQAASQPDPTSSPSITFTVGFSAPVADFTTNDVTITGTAGGTKTVAVTGGPAAYTVTVSLSGVTSSGTVIASIAAGVAHDAAGTGNTASTSSGARATYNGVGPVGLQGEYFGSPNLTGLRACSVDPTVNFDWTGGSPDPSLGSVQFSVRWTGQVVPQFSELYTFCTMSDDGVRLWVNTQPVIDNWTDHAPTENCGTIALVGGQSSSIRMEYYQATGAAVARLLWSSASQPKQVIPQNRLYLPGAGPRPPPPTPLTVTLNQAASQPDPTSSPSITFTVGFSASVADFTTNDVTITGTAGGTKTVAVTGGPAAYTVTVSLSGVNLEWPR